MGLYSEFEIKGGKRYKVPFPSSRNDIISSDKSLAGRMSYWWGTEESRISTWLPGLRTLEQQSSNRAIIVLSASSLLFLIWNTFFGMAKGGNGSRDHTLDLSEYIGGADQIHHLAPHYDSVSLLLIAFMGSVLWSTMPESALDEEE